MLNEEEVMLLRFAMKCYGLDMTTTMRLLIRSSVIDLICIYRETGVPKLPEDIGKAVDEL